jgi:hypothetical protein
MAALPQSQPQGAEPQEELQVRVVRLSDLGAKKPRPEAPPQPPPAAPSSNGAALAPASPTRSRTAPLPPQSSPVPQARALNGHATPQARQPAARPTAPVAPQRPTPKAPPAAAKRTAAPAVARPEHRKPLLSSGRVFFVLACVLLYFGWATQTERYITPKRGVGYSLGIIGGSLMLILLVYSLRKRWHWLRFLGSTPSWFRFHMVLGILGPLCILYHANFATGATNSNVALFAMLTVAGSGLAGRYIYAHIHHGLYGRKLELKDLRAGQEGLRKAAGSISFLPELATRLEQAETRVLKSGPSGALLGFVTPVLVAFASMRQRWQLHRYIRHSLSASARKSAVVAAEQKRLRQSAVGYVDRRLAATRRVAEFEGYERLFSLWHALHIPLIFMMIIAAIIHVIAVHVY